VTTRPHSVNCPSMHVPPFHVHIWRGLFGETGRVSACHRGQARWLTLHTRFKDFAQLLANEPAISSSILVDPAAVRTR